jgi:hypothetical protein
VQSVVNFEGLDWWVTDRDLLSACERFGRVKHVKIALEKVYHAFNSYRVWFMCNVGICAITGEWKIQRLGVGRVYDA